MKIKAKWQIDRRLLSTLIIVGVMIFIANHSPVSEQLIYEEYYTGNIAEKNNPDKESFSTFPMWGYPALVDVFSDPARKAIQLVFGVLTAYMVFKSLRSNVPKSYVYYGLVILLSAPWFAFMSLNSASAISVPLLWLGIFVIVARKWTVRYEIRVALIAGLLVGLSLNFRSDFLLVVFAIPIGLIAQRWSFLSESRQAVKGTLLSAFIFGTVAIVMLVPWGIYSKVEVNQFRLTSSNGGAVSYISLGQLPENPWGIIHEDQQAVRALENSGNGDVHPYSVEGDKLLRAEFFGAIRSEPVAFAQKLIHNGRNIAFGGLYFGDWEVWLPGVDEERIDVAKEKIKSAIGLNPNLSEIERYKATGAWAEDPTHSEYALLGMAAGAVIATSLLIVIGVLSLAYKALRWRMSAAEFMFAIVLLYVLALVVILQYQPRHMNAAWPAIVIFGMPVILSWWERLSNLITRTRSTESQPVRHAKG